MQIKWRAAQRERLHCQGMFYQRLSAGTVGITHAQPSSTGGTRFWTEQGMFCVKDSFCTENATRTYHILMEKHFIESKHYVPNASDAKKTGIYRMDSQLSVVFVKTRKILVFF